MSCLIMPDNGKPERGLRQAGRNLKAKVSAALNSDNTAHKRARES